MTGEKYLVHRETAPNLPSYLEPVDRHLQCPQNSCSISILNMGLSDLLTNLSGQLVLLFCFLLMSRITWDLLFSPLGAFRGPFIARFTDAWRAAWTARGDIDTTHLRCRSHLVQRMLSRNQCFEF